MIRISKSSCAIAAVAIALGAVPALAQQQPQRPQVVTQFDDATVSNLLQDVRATWQIDYNDQGEANYRASAEGDINFTLSPRACSPETGCLGLMMIAIYTGVSAPSAVELDAFINRVNDRDATAKIYRMPDGTVVLQEYVNAAYGISYLNAQAQLLVFGEDLVAVSRALATFERGN
jgi:hypothetical protein